MSGLSFHHEGGTLRKEEKKVEYLELIYDLIFVYIIGRNNSLLHHVENGFVPGTTFLTYVMCSLAIIQIWNFSTFYINMHGRNGLRDHVSLFLNMYLLYYIGEGTRLHWESFQNQYCIAWALILLNIGTQYVIELRNCKSQPSRLRAIRRMVMVLYGEALLVLLLIPIFNRTGAALSAVPILFGMNNLTTSLEFMQDEEVALWPKTLFLIVSFVLYFLCLFALQVYAKKDRGICRQTVVPIAVITAVFILPMLLLRERMHLNILLSVLYVAAIFLWMLRFSREKDCGESAA